jgi:dihydrofolate synthase/folylpolyglutamate synthase
VNFHESEAYLLSLGNEVETMKLGLENIRKLLEALGNPQNKYKKVQVAGTNGKGSVCAFLNSICLQAGIKTGLYTSPHLVSITERIRIDGVDISEKKFARLATLIRETSENLVSDGVLESLPTYFEQVTAMALAAFAEAGVELAILETGLGGRFDATTAANAEIAAITRIDLDHQEYLGETLAEIATEKTAIIRVGSKVVVLHQLREVEHVIMGRCREVGVEPKWATRSIQIKRDREIAPHLVATFTTENAAYGNILFMHMQGEHQIENASVAIAIAEVLYDCDFSIDRESIISGMENAEHPGRIERHGRFLFDGAHNESGAWALREYLNEFILGSITLIFGAMKDKNVGEMVDTLLPRADRVILTQPSNSRAMDVDELAKNLPPNFDNSKVYRSESVADAINKARVELPADGTIIVTGSLYLIGEVKKLLQSNGESDV